MSNKTGQFIKLYKALPIALVTSLPFDHVTLINLHISSYREATGAMFIHANA